MVKKAITVCDVCGQECTGSRQSFLTKNMIRVTITKGADGDLCDDCNVSALHEALENLKEKP